MPIAADDAGELVEALRELRRAEARVAAIGKSGRWRQSDFNRTQGVGRWREQSPAYKAMKRNNLAFWERKWKPRRDDAIALRIAKRDAMRERVAVLARRLVPAAQRYGIPSTDLIRFVETWNPDLMDSAAAIASSVDLCAKDKPPPVVGFWRIDSAAKRIAESGLYQLSTHPVAPWVYAGLVAVILAVVAMIRSC
jgi:hypothetical protein